MTISVVIPSYNQSEFLNQAIDSALAQTLNAHEIIVVEDGSTDNSLEIARAYEGRIKVISQTNRGLSSARNTGIMNATGDYLFFLDSDDIMLENCIKRVSEVIEETYADVVAPSFKTFGTSNEQVILMPNPTVEDFKPKNGLPRNRIGYFSAFKRSALLEVGGYSPKMIWGWEDYHLTINLLSVGKTLFTIPEVLILYRTKEKSMITEANAHSTELLVQLYKDFPSLHE